MAKAVAGSGFAERVGGAICRPARALADADRDEAAGRGPTDLAAVIALVFVAVNLETVVRAVYLMFSGELGGGFQTLITRVAADLQGPLVVLLVGFVCVTAFAGRRRSFGADSDLAAVAFIPAVFVWALLAAWNRFVGAGARAHDVFMVVAVAWFAVGVLLAIRQARGRQLGDDTSGQAATT